MRSAALGAVLAGSLLLAACGDDVTPQEARSGTIASRESVQAAARSVADLAADAGLEVAQLTGRWTVCSVEPARDKYAAGGSAVPTGDVAATVAAITDAMEQDGWTVETTTTGREPSATLSRGDLRAGVGAARHRPGEVDFGVRGQCVAASETSDGSARETFAP